MLSWSLRCGFIVIFLVYPQNPMPDPVKINLLLVLQTEDGKERALAEHSISICNTQLFISRIDIPRTTVARISNLSKSAMKDVRALCVPYGQIKQVYIRGNGVVDVLFDVSEWPNMLTILNR